MSFRRSKEAAREAARWRDFVRENASLFRAAGLPTTLSNSRHLFDYALMHGCSDGLAEATWFDVGQLSAPEYDEFLNLVAAYLRAGFADPGLSLPGGNRISDEIHRRAGLAG